MYEVMVYIPSNDKELANIIEKEGVKAIRTKTGVKVTLPFTRGGYYQIPEVIMRRNHTVFISLEEMSNDNYAQIICAPNGKPIYPIYIKGKQAIFRIYKTGVVIIAYKEKGSIKISITMLSIKKRHDKVELKQLDIGNEEEISFLKTGIIPPSFKKFREPILAAISKLKHNDSSRPFYIGTT